MLDLVRSLSARTKELRRVVRSLNSPQVRRKVDRERARALVDDYFRSLREQARIFGIHEAVLHELDDKMHGLLEASQKLSATSTYDAILKDVADCLFQVEKAALSPQHQAEAKTYEPTDRLIVETLSRILPSAGRAYEQALRDLMGPERLSWRGPATDLRESLREVLDHLAPDDDVTSQPNFKLEPDQVGPTMKQKVRFILGKRGVSKTASKSPEASAQAVDEIVGTFVRSVYTRSSVSTHTPTQRIEVSRIHEYVRAALCELLEVHAGA